MNQKRYRRIYEYRTQIGIFHAIEWTIILLTQEDFQFIQYIPWIMEHHFYKYSYNMWTCQTSDTPYTLLYL